MAALAASAVETNAPAPARAEEPFASALADLRRRSAVVIATLRVLGTTTLLALAAWLGLLNGLAGWRDSLPLHAGYAAIAVVLLAALRSPGLRGHVSAAVPIVDVLAVCLLTSDSLPRSAFPAGVAGWTLGPFVVLVLLASLTLRPGLIYATALTAWVCEALLQRQAGVAAGAMVASGLVLLLAAAATHWAEARIEALVRGLVAEQVQARLALERSQTLLRANAATAEANALLEEQHGKLLAAQREAEVLSSLLVHDMKGPLSTVLMRLELAQREVAEDQSLLRFSKDLRIAKVQGQRLLAMVEDLLAIARLERGTLTPRKEPVELEPLFADVICAYEALAQTVEAEVRAFVEPQLVAAVDRELVQRVLENLLSNALRFVKSGDRVELLAARQGGGLLLTVRNTGQPIAPELQSRLFERFSGKGERARGNAGLGLYFCRLVAEAHGGGASLEEQPPFNVAFVLRLPLS